MEFAGRSLGRAPPATAIEAGVGFLPDDRKREGLVLQQSLRDNAMLTLRAFALPWLRRPRAAHVRRPRSTRR